MSDQPTIHPMNDAVSDEVSRLVRWIEHLESLCEESEKYANILSKPEVNKDKNTKMNVQMDIYNVLVQFYELRCLDRDYTARPNIDTLAKQSRGVFMKRLGKIDKTFATLVFPPPITKDTKEKVKQEKVKKEVKEEVKEPTRYAKCVCPEQSIVWCPVCLCDEERTHMRRECKNGHKWKWVGDHEWNTL